MNSRIKVYKFVSASISPAPLRLPGTQHQGGNEDLIYHLCKAKSSRSPGVHFALLVNSSEVKKSCVLFLNW